MIEKYKIYSRVFFVLFWVAMCFGFVSEEFLPFLKPLRNPVMFGMETVVAVMGLLLIRTKKDLLFLGSFLVIGLISTFFLNRLSLFNFLTGSRDFFGLLFVIPILRYFLTGRYAFVFKESFDRQLKIWLAIQFVCLVWQFIRYGANDHGGGSMGNGASGMVSMLIYIVSLYFVLQNWDYTNYRESFRRNKWYFVALFPTYLNETKVSFVLLAVYIVMLYRPTKKTMMYVVYLLPVVALLGVGLIKVYFAATNQSEDEVLTWDFVSEYFVAPDIDYNIEMAMLMQDGAFEDDMTDEESIWYVDIQRLSKLLLVGEPLEKTKGGLLFGAGLGHIRGLNQTKPTAFVKEYKWLISGSRPWAFTVLVQIGIVGVIWFLLLFYFDTYRKYSSSDIIRRLGIYIFLCFIMLMVYSEALGYYYFCMVFFYVVFAMRLTNPANQPASLRHDNIYDFE